jgi:hypothetical protein
VEYLVGNKKQSEMKQIVLFTLSIISITALRAQDTSRLYFTTGIGVIKVKHVLRDVLKPSVAFNSGIELRHRKNWFIQGTVDFNTLKYDQKVRDESSPYLFQNTNSSLIMLGLNGGRNFPLNKNWFVSAYAGGGYLNIGEPRVTVKNTIVTQEVIRNSSIFGRAGGRIAFKSPIRFLQTIYVDAEWWTSSVKIQNFRLTGLAFFVGTRMSM